MKDRLLKYEKDPKINSIVIVTHTVPQKKYSRRLE